MCLVTPKKQDGKIFGFAEFVQAFALLLLVYTLSDTRYRFRLAISPIPLFRWTYYACALIGVGTLATDIWFTHSLPLPSYLADQLLWQAVFGITFLGVALIWMRYAFIRPAIFGKRNAEKFARTIYSYIVRGSNTELPIIASELIVSAQSIVAFVKEYNGSDPSETVTPGRIAHEVMLLMGSRTFCRHVIMSSPGTAIAFFTEMSRQKSPALSMSQFASNISTEAVLNKDSLLYHEDSGYYSGLLGYIKPFSKAVYGDWTLVETLAQNRSPLDISWDDRSGWDAPKLEAYCRVVLITFENYLANNGWHQHSYALYRAFHSIEHACSDLTNLDGLSEYYKRDENHRLEVVLRFIQDAIKLLDKYKLVPRKLRQRETNGPMQDDYYDTIAKMYFELVLRGGYLKGPPETCWGIQHNGIWYALFSLHSGRALEIVRFKVRRLIYDEILCLQDFPNFKSSRILGFCLAVMGVKIGSKKGFGKEEYAIRKAVVSWCKHNFQTLHKAQPFVAETCLLGSISFDKESGHLIRTYARNLDLTPRQDILELDPAKPNPNQ